MADSVVFRPRSTGLGLGMIALPSLSAISVLLGVAAVLTLNPLVGLSIFIACQLLAVLPLWLLHRLLTLLFALEVGPTGLTIIGLYGTSTVSVPWSSLSWIGLADHHGTPMLAIRPKRPYAASPRRPLIWDPSTNLLLITPLDNWSSPRDQILTTLQSTAGPLWTPNLTLTSTHNRAPVRGTLHPHSPS